MNTYQTTSDDAITVTATITDAGEGAVVVVDDGTRTFTVTLGHEPGGMYTEDDLPRLCDLTLDRFVAMTSNGDTHASTATVHRTTLAGLDFVHIKDTSPPRWVWPRLNFHRPTGDRWWYLGIGWRFTAHSVGVRRHKTGA